MGLKHDVEPFDNCPALDGYHCQTNSLAKIFFHNNCPLSEDMLLGLGAGLGFMYWHQKGVPPFIGGRGNVKEFYGDLGKRVGVKIKVKSTSSETKAERALVEMLLKKEPLMVYGDMGFLPGLICRENTISEDILLWSAAIMAKTLFWLQMWIKNRAD